MNKDTAGASLKLTLKRYGRTESRRRCWASAYLKAIAEKWKCFSSTYYYFL